MAVLPMLHVRKNVLRLTQAELAVVARVSQGTVSKWETGELEPGWDQLARIRAEIRRLELVWDDRWFFEAPPEPAEAAAA